MAARQKSRFRALQSWQAKSDEIDFFDLKGSLVSLFEKLHFDVSLLSFEPLDTSTLFQKGAAAEIFYQKRPMGRGGKISLQVQERFDVRGNDQSIFLCELDVPRIQSLVNSCPKFKAIPRYPSIQRDLSLLLPEGEDVSYDKLVRFIEQKGTSLLKEVSLFDRYVGDPIPEGHVSLSFRLIYNSSDRTLKDEEVSIIHLKLCQELQSTWQVKIR